MSANEYQTVTKLVVELLGVIKAAGAVIPESINKENYPILAEFIEPMAGDELRAIREEIGETQESFGWLVGRYSETHIWRLENNRRKITKGIAATARGMLADFRAKKQPIESTEVN